MIDGTCESSGASNVRIGGAEVCFTDIGDTIDLAAQIACFETKRNENSDGFRVYRSE